MLTKKAFIGKLVPLFDFISIDPSWYEFKFDGGEYTMEAVNVINSGHENMREYVHRVLTILFGEDWGKNEKV